MNKEALEFHAKPTPGKIEVIPSKPTHTERFLSLAYSPGVAAPCREIARDPLLVYEYTTKGNLVAVITNGTAVLGLGDIGPLAAKPVMEGKGLLFKQFADINVFDLELKTETVDEFVSAVKALEPTFGGINLEDIKAPECFVIEERLKKLLKIPVFHDDQHGTAIISCAALINACSITNRELGKIKMVINGAGAAAIACARLFVKLGVPKHKIILCDRTGVVYEGRTEGMNQYKSEFATDQKVRTLAEALVGADVFVGLSSAGAMSKEMLRSMADRPIVFAMANPDPEIHPNDAFAVREDLIMATGRSDFPNQVNNVLGYPYIFRGALDVRATCINEEMKLAAVHALAELARQEVPDSVSQAYGGQTFHFGPDYIIPKPFDPRVLLSVAPAVAKAAMDCGVAQKPIADLGAYRDRLEASQGATRGFIRSAIHRIKTQARAKKKEVPLLAIPEASSPSMLRALHSVVEEGVVRPILLGRPEEVGPLIEELDLDLLRKLPVYRPSKHPNYNKYVEAFFALRQRKGVMLAESRKLMMDPLYFAAMMVRMGDADALITGSMQNYAESVRPILQVIGPGSMRTASGLNIVLVKRKMILFADTAVNIDPSAEQLANIAIHAAKVARYFGLIPKIAMLSYSNFAAGRGSPEKMHQAVELVRKLDPSLIVDGEMQADTAVKAEIVERIFPFCHIRDGANILIFPNLDAGNIAYKLVQQLGGGEVIGPFLMGVKKPANVVQRTGSIDDIINGMVLTALQAQAQEELSLLSSDV